MDSHSFPQHFIESKEQLGLAPAAIVVSRKESYDTSLALKSVDYNRQIRPHSPAIGQYENIKQFAFLFFFSFSYSYILNFTT